MNKGGQQNQRGFGHLGIILAIVVLVGIGGVGYTVSKRSQDAGKTPEEKALQTALNNAKCEYDDKDLCKFFTSWAGNPAYTMTVTTKGEGSDTKLTIKTEGPTRSHFSFQGDTPYETITIDKTTYIKTPNGSWWKQTLPDTPNSNPENANTPVDFREPTTDSDVKVEYKKLGKEACGNLSCFKYEVVDSSSSKDSKELIWFDDKDYRVRRTQTTTATTSSNATFDYAKVSISAPAGAKELGPNQYLVPGQNEPTTLPSTSEADTAEMQRLLEQYQAQQ